MERKVVVHSGLLCLMAGLLAAVAVIRSGRPQPPVQRTQAAHVSTTSSPPIVKTDEPEPARRIPDSNPGKLPAALHDATLKGLIQNAKVAELRRDAKTRDAMVRGLKKQPERSRELIQQEITASRDTASASALQKLMEILQ